MKFEEARKKYNDGDRLTDEELDALYWYYFNVYHAVSAENDPAYRLVWQDAFKKSEDLQRIRDARSEEKTL